MRSQCTDVFWIRVHLALFDDSRWAVIEQMPESDAIQIIYIRLLMLAGKSNADGLLLLCAGVPYDIESLTAVLRRKKMVVELALSILTKYSFIEFLDDTFAVIDWDRLQATDVLAKIAKQKKDQNQRQSLCRQKKKIELNKLSRDRGMTSLPTDSNADIDKDTTEDVVTLAYDEIPKIAALMAMIPVSAHSPKIKSVVSTAVKAHGEYYALSNISYSIAHHNPNKGTLGGLIIAAFAEDYASGERIKESELAEAQGRAIQQRQRQEEIDKRRGEELTEVARRWMESSEGQAWLLIAKTEGIDVPNLHHKSLA